MYQKVESLIPVSNGYLYSVHAERVGEQEENAKSPHGRDNVPSISLLMSMKLNVLIYSVVGKYIMLHKEYILMFR